MVNNTKKRKLIKKRGGGNAEKQEPLKKNNNMSNQVEVKASPETSLKQKQSEPAPAETLQQSTSEEAENPAADVPHSPAEPSQPEITDQAPQPEVADVPETLVQQVTKTPVEQPLPLPPQLNKKMTNALNFAVETDKLVESSELEIRATNNVQNTRLAQLNKTLKAVINQLKLASKTIRSLSNPMMGGYKKTKKRGGKFTKYPY
jgi:hypothetical protein